MMGYESQRIYLMGTEAGVSKQNVFDDTFDRIESGRV